MARKRKPWNKNRVVGQMRAFTISEVEKIRRIIGERSQLGQRDLLMFNLAIDAMIPISELLSLTVKDVKHANGTIRSLLEIPRGKRRAIHRCALSKATMVAMKNWLAMSGLKDDNYIFPGRGGAPHPLAARNLNRLIKDWVTRAGLDPTQYGTESLRRTKALHILNSTGDLDTVRMLLGHTKIESTAMFLQVSRKVVDPIAVARAHDF